MKALQAHLNKWLLAYVVVVMGLGVLLGHPHAEASWVKAHQGGISTLTTVAVFMIIYPMMANLRLEGLLKAGKNLKGLVLALVFNFVRAPLLGYGLAHLFITDNPPLALGFSMAFSPMVAVPAATMPIFQILLMVVYLKLAGVVRAYFAQGRSREGAGTAQGEPYEHEGEGTGDRLRQLQAS